MFIHIIPTTMIKVTVTIPLNKEMTNKSAIPDMSNEVFNMLIETIKLLADGNSSELDVDKATRWATKVAVIMIDKIFSKIEKDADEVAMSDEVSMSVNINMDWLGPQKKSK